MTRLRKLKNSSVVTSLQTLYAVISARSSSSRGISENRRIASTLTTSVRGRPICYTNESWPSARSLIGLPPYVSSFGALKRRFPPDSIPYPNYSHHRTPRVLSPEEVTRLIDAAGNLQARTILMTLYSTGMRRGELVRLRVEDDSERMVIHIHQGKGGKDRDVPLCPRLLETLLEYWRWKKPKTWLFPGQPIDAGTHLTDKAVWNTCQDAALHAGIKKRVSPHMLRNASAYYTTFQKLFIPKEIAAGQHSIWTVYGHVSRFEPAAALLVTSDPSAG